MHLLKFGLCFVISISCVSKISGDSSRRLLNTELECSEDGVLQSGPCMQCICVQQRIVCVKILCGLEDDDDSASVPGTEGIAMYQKVRPPEIIVKLPNSPIKNIVNEQPIQDILQEEVLPDQVVAVSIMSSDDSQEDELGLPVSTEPQISLVYKKERNILDLLADNTPNDSTFMTENREKDILKPLLASSNDNKNDKYLLIVPEDFQSSEDEFENKLPHRVMGQNILNNNFKTHPSRHDKLENVPFLVANKNKKGNSNPVIAADGYGRPVVIPLARQPLVFARPGDKRLFMRPRHYMRNDDSPRLEKIKTFKHPWFYQKPVDKVSAKGPDTAYWYDLLQNQPGADLNSQYESVGHKWPFTEEKPTIGFKSYKKFKYPWLNQKLGGINGPADQSNPNYYKLLQQYGDGADLSSYYMKGNPHKDHHYHHQSHMYNNVIPDDHEHYNSYANADGYDSFSNRYEKADIDQNLILDGKGKEFGNFNISEDQQFIKPSLLGNDQAINKEYNSSFPKIFESMNQIPISHKLQGKNVNEYPGVFDQKNNVNTLIPISNNQPNIDDTNTNKNQTAMTDQLKWQDVNGYAEILSNKQPKPALEFDGNDLFGTGNNQQIFNFLQQKNDSNYDSKYISNQFAKISQSLQKRPLLSMSAIMPGQTQSGSNINNSNEQILFPNELQLEQNENAYLGELSSKHPGANQYIYKLPANIIQTIGNKKLVNYTSNDSQYTSNNFSKVLYAEQNTPIISISEMLPSDSQEEKPGSAISIQNENTEDIVKQIKWLQDHNYVINNKNHKPILQSSSAYTLKPEENDYFSTNSDYPKKHQKLLPDQFLWQSGDNHPNVQNYEDREPVHNYEDYGVLVSGNHEIFSNRPKVKNSKHHKYKWPLVSQPNSDKIKLSKHQKSTFDQDKNWQPCGANENCGYKSWPSGKNVRPIPLSILLGDTTDLQIPNDEQKNSIKYEDSEGNIFITVPFTNGGIPDLENQDNVLLNQKNTNYITLTYPDINNYTQELDNEQTKIKMPWYFTNEDENNANKFPDLSLTMPPSTLIADLNNVPQQYYDIPEENKYEFSQLNSIVPNEPVLLPYLSKSKKHKHNYYPKSHKNIGIHKPKHFDKNIPFDLQNVISDKYLNVMPNKNKPYLNKVQILDNNITPKLPNNVPNYKVYPNPLYNHESEIPAKDKYYQQNVLPMLSNTIPRPYHNTIATLPHSNPLIYNRKPVPIMASNNNMNPLKLFNKPNYYPLLPKGPLLNNKVHIKLPNNMQVLPKVFPKRVVSAHTPQFYLQNSIPKFPAKNLFSNLYEYYYPKLSSFPQVTRNKPESTVVSDILKLLKKLANNNPLKLIFEDFLNYESQMPVNTGDYETDEGNPQSDDYNTNFISTGAKLLTDYDNNEVDTYDFQDTVTKPSGKSNVHIVLPEESLSRPLDKNLFLTNKHPSKKINDRDKQTSILPDFGAKNKVSGNTFNYDLNNYDYNEEYPVYRDTSDIEYLENYVNNLLPDLIPPDSIKPTYKKTSNAGCVVCETFNNNINLLAKYLNNNHQENDIMYLVLKDIIKPLVQFVQKMILDNNKFPSKITSVKPEALGSHSKDENISVSPKLRPFNKKNNRYYPNNSKLPSFNLNGINNIYYQNDSQVLPDKESLKDRLNQYNSSPLETVNYYSKPDKSRHLTSFNKYFKKQPTTKKQPPHGIAREDKSVNYGPNQNLDNPRSYQRESQMVEDDVHNNHKKTIGKTPPNENRVSFEDYLDIPIEGEENSDEYSPYHKPILHKISSFESDPNRKVYLYKNPNAKYVEGPYLPKTGVNIKLYDKPHDSDEDPVLTDEFNLIPMGIPKPKQNSDEDYEVQNNHYNTKSREFYDRIRIALHNPYEKDNIEPVYNTKIPHNRKEKPITDHHIIVPTFYPEQICSLCKTLNCGRHVSNDEQSNSQNSFLNHIPNQDQVMAYTDSNPINTPLLDTNILSRLVRVLILNIIAESNSYAENTFQETQFMNKQESSILSDIFSLLEYYQIINNINKPHTIYNLFHNTLPIISSYNAIDIQSQSEPDFIPFQNDNSPYLDSIILNTNIQPDTTSNAILEILKRINEVNIGSNNNVLANIILEKLKPCSDSLNFEDNEYSELIPNYVGSAVIPLRTMLSQYKSLYQDLSAMVIKMFEISQSEEEPKKSIWSKTKMLLEKARYLPQYLNRLKPLSLRKILSPSTRKRPFSNNIVNYIKNIKGSKSHNFMPKKLEKSNIYGKHIKPETTKKLNFNDIYKTIKHAWEAYLLSDEDQLDLAKFLKPKAKDYFITKPTKDKDEEDLSSGSDQLLPWQEGAHPEIRPIRGMIKPNHYLNKDHTNKYFNYGNAFKEKNKYRKPVINKNFWQKYNDNPYDLDAKLWEHNAKHNINEKPGYLMNKRPSHFIEPYKGNKFNNVEPSNKSQKSNIGQFFPKRKFKPTYKGTKYDDKEGFNENGRPFKGHKYPAIKSLKHAWKISNVLSDQGTSTLPKYLKPRGIKEEPNHILNNNPDLKPILDDELSAENQYSFTNDLKPIEIQNSDSESIKNKRNPKIALSKIRPFNQYKNSIKIPWQKTTKPHGLGQSPLPKYLKPKDLEYPDQSNQYKNIPDDVSISYPFESYEQVNPEPDIIQDLSQLSSTENFEPTTKEIIKYSDMKQVSGEFYSNDPFKHQEHFSVQPRKHIWTKPESSPDLSSENLELNSNEIKYTTLEPIKYTDLVHTMSNYSPFGSHEEIDSNPKKHIFQSPDLSFVKGQLPYTKYLEPEDNVNEYSNEEVMKSKETEDILFNQDHSLSSETLEPNDEENTYTTLEPIKFTDLLQEISNYDTFKSHEEIDSKHTLESPETSFVGGQLPYTKYFKPQDNANEYSNEEALKNMETADTLFNSNHDLNQNSDHAEHFKARKLADLETEDNSWEKPETSTDQGTDWTAADSNENYWEKRANDNDDLHHSVPTESEINLSSTLHPLSQKKENPDDPNSDFAAILDYINKKQEPTEKDERDYNEPISEIDSKGRNARWVDVTDFNIQRHAYSPNTERYEYTEVPLIEDDSDLT